MNKKITGSALIAGILASVVAIEGQYSNDPNDPGGATKYGITERVAREFGYTGRMEDLTLELANEIYTKLYVLDPHFERVLELNPAIGHKLIDAGVNVGTARVSFWFQQALNSFSKGGTDYPLIPEDGIIGEKTLETYRYLENRRGKEKACTLMLKALDGFQFNYYVGLKRYYQYIPGWVDKRVGNVPMNQCTEYNLITPLSISNYEDQ